MSWYPTWDLNPHFTDSKSALSSSWSNRAYGAASWIRTNNKGFKDLRVTITLWRYI